MGPQGEGEGQADEAVPDDRARHRLLLAGVGRRQALSCDHLILPFRAHHLDGVHWIEERHARLIGIERALKAYEEHPGFTGVCGDRFVAAAGIVRPFPGVGEAWAILGPLAQSHRVFVHRTVQSSVIHLAQSMGLRRLQALVRAEFGLGAAWCERLGFRLEARLRRYGVMGEDMLMYVMFPDEVENA